MPNTSNPDNLMSALVSIKGVLQPVADMDWHGKWRVRRAIEEADAALQQHRESRNG